VRVRGAQRSAGEIANDLVAAFDKHCTELSVA
jgi:hypothetical protein